jgi:hypothetical protein
MEHRIERGRTEAETEEKQTKQNRQTQINKQQDHLIEVEIKGKNLPKKEKS